MEKLRTEGILLPVIKRYAMIDVATNKLAIWTLGITGWVFTMWQNLGTWKSDVLFAVTLAAFFFTGYWKWRRNLRVDRKSAQEERKRDLDLLEQELRMKKYRELENNQTKNDEKTP